MATLLELLDQMMSTAVQTNVYNDANQYLDAASARENTPPAAPSTPYNIKSAGIDKTGYTESQAGAPLKRDEIYAKSNDLSRTVAVIPNIESQIANRPETGDIRGSYNRGNPYNGDDFSIGGTNAPMAGALQQARWIDVFAIAHWLRNIGTEFGAFAGRDVNAITGEVDTRPTRNIVKGITSLALPLLLGTLNPTDDAVGGTLNAVVNPLSYVLSSLPIRVSTTVDSPNLAAATSGFGEVYTTAMNEAILNKSERLLQMREGKYVKGIDGNLLIKPRFGVHDAGFAGDLSEVKPTGHSTLENPEVNLPPTLITTQVDGKGNALLKSSIHTNIYTPENPYNKDGTNAIMPLEKLEAAAIAAIQDSNFSPHAKKLETLFVAKTWPGGEPAKSPSAFTWVSKSPLPTDVGIALPASAGPGEVSVRTHNSENPDTGLVPALEAISENEMYLPFCFQDMRADVNELLYFRAFLKQGTSETFTPDWQVERYYGRVDQVPIYVGTMRSIVLSFDVVAWSPADLRLMYKKLHKLQSMVYPMYDTGGFLKAGPIIRMRVGDLFVAAGKKGLPGYITSLDFSYDDGIWNLETDFKVPRKVSVSLGFNVVHEGNPGIYPLAGWNLDTAPGGTGEVIGGTESGAPTFGTAKFANDGITTGVTVSEADLRGILTSTRGGSS